MSRQDDFVSQTRQAATDLLATLDKLQALQNEWNALNYSGTLTAFNGQNANVTKAQIAAVIGTTLDAFKAQIAAGHGTNLQTIRN